MTDIIIGAGCRRAWGEHSHPARIETKHYDLDTTATTLLHATARGLGMRPSHWEDAE